MSLSYAILTALVDEDLTGYELAKQFDVSLGFFWQASHQQIYKELKHLHGEGAVKVREVPQLAKPDRRVYSLTDVGKEKLQAWLLQPSRPRSAKDELFIKLYNLGTVPATRLAEVIKQRRQSHRAKLALYQKIEAGSYANPAQLSDRQKGIYLSLLAGILQEETSLNWCDQALELLGTVAEEALGSSEEL